MLPISFSSSPRLQGSNLRLQFATSSCKCAVRRLFPEILHEQCAIWSVSRARPGSGKFFGFVRVRELMWAQKLRIAFITFAPFIRHKPYLVATAKIPECNRDQESPWR